MAATLKRKNAALLDFLRGGYVGLLTFLGLSGLGFGPPWAVAVLAVSAGGLTLASFELGVFVCLASLAIPVLAVAPVMGILYLVVALIALRYVGASKGAVFIVVTTAVLGTFVGPAWAIVGLAGYLLGAKRGALAAALGCIATEVIGFALGKPWIGVTATAGTSPLVDLSKLPADLLSTEWIPATLKQVDAQAFESIYDSIVGVTALSALVVQPMLWALGAILTATISRALWQSGRNRLAPFSTIAGVAVPAIPAVALGSIVGLPHDPQAVAVAFGLSAAAAVAISFAWDLLFPIEAPPPAPGAYVPSTMAAEDEDVDELLRLIASAEEKVATQYTSVKTVMITDMKSFSAMTEECGSAMTAKTVQLHRDLLLPVIGSHQGCGKSAGGDGLIAAFDDAATAVAASVEMQQVLAEYNRNHPYDRELTVRIGIAYGEVVLDRGGRPFIGNALNVAARIMNLADGGQAFTTASVAGRAGLDIPTHSHGQFELKNIDKPVEVIELLWHEGQVPLDPRSRTTPPQVSPPQQTTTECGEGPE